ncbi:alpha/beta fold hydrolase [Ancylobacter dichloromethanicus]
MAEGRAVEGMAVHEGRDGHAVRTRYRRQGVTGATPVVLVHGVGMAIAAWEPQIAALAARFDVIALDMPGHGGSSLPPVDARLSDYSDAVIAVLDALKLPAAVVVGHSMGGRWWRSTPLWLTLPVCSASPRSMPCSAARRNSAPPCSRAPRRWPGRGRRRAGRVASGGGAALVRRAGAAGAAGGGRAGRPAARRLRPRRLCAHLCAVRYLRRGAPRAARRAHRAGAVHDRRRRSQFHPRHVRGDGRSRPARTGGNSRRRAAHDEPHRARRGEPASSGLPRRGRADAPRDEILRPEGVPAGARRLPHRGHGGGHPR